MYRFRDKMVADLELNLITHTNPDGIAQNINPFTHGSAKHTDIMKTEGLKQALDKYGFDAAFGGARRDEEKSRAKERVYSSAIANTAGILKISVQSCGRSTTARSRRANPSACSRCRTGLSWIFGSTSISKVFRLCRCTWRLSVR